MSRGGPPAPIHVVPAWASGDHRLSSTSPCGPEPGTDLATGGTAWVHSRIWPRPAGGEARQAAPTPPAPGDVAPSAPGPAAGAAAEPFGARRGPVGLTAQALEAPAAGQGLQSADQPAAAAPAPAPVTGGTE